ncbi:serine hydrolase domain-containing protein [Intestinibacter sp.]
MNQEKVKEFETIIKKDYANTCGVVVMKDGKMTYESYYNGCDSNSTVHIYSVTKSIISILMGIAIDKGYIKSLDQKVLDFFPDYKVIPGEKTIQNITLKDMLTMTAPYKQKEDPYVEYFTSPDYLKFTLDLLGGDDKIGEFRYTPLIGPDIFTGIIRNVTHQSVLDFAFENLFKPLGIKIGGNIIFNSAEEQFAFNEATDISGWVTDPTGLNTAGWGLTLTANDMAKIGQLYLNGGVSNCKRIVSTKWIKQSTTPHRHWNNLSYGYLWWVLDDHSFAALGDGGNTIYVNSEKNLVISISALFVPNAKDRI